jgi:hypothetical protein
MNIARLFERRSFLKAAAGLGSLFGLWGRATVAHAQEQDTSGEIGSPSAQVRMADIPPSSINKVTVERRGRL